MCLHPKHIKIKNQHPSPAFPESYIELDVPCGKCLACIKRRQTDYSTRLYRETQSASTMWFITLTYRNANIPIASSLYRVHCETGEEERVKVMQLENDNQRLYDLRREFASMRSSSSPRYVSKYFSGSDGQPLKLGNYYYIVKYTPSLNREDVKNWIKGCRVQYERDFGEKLDFRYAWCGEYGPNGCRPHYHLCVLNCTKEQIDYMLARWRHGYVYKSFVPQLNPDGSNARLLASRYIGKYVSKGKFDCQSVLDCDAQKGRLCNSKRFGTFDFTDEEISYYRAYDLFGAYDIDTLQFVDSKYVFDKLEPKLPKYLSEEQQKLIAKTVFERSYYQVCVGDKLYKLPLPKAFRIRLFYIHDVKYEPKIDKKGFEFKPYFRASKLSRLVMDYLQDIASIDDMRKFEEFCSNNGFSEDDINSRLAYEQYCEDNTQCELERLDESDFSLELFTSCKDGQ